MASHDSVRPLKSQIDPEFDPCVVHFPRWSIIVYALVLWVYIIAQVAYTVHVVRSRAHTTHDNHSVKRADTIRM